MGSSSLPPNFDDENNFNSSIWHDFWQTNYKLGQEVLRNKSKSTMLENITTVNMSKHSVAECDEYCDSHLREILMDYRMEYHGYVSLIVS